MAPESAVTPSDEEGQDGEVQLLIVDDDPLFVELCIWYLSQELSCTYRVRVAHNACDAEAICKSVTFDCLLIDFRLPDKSGIQLIQSLDQLTPGAASSAIIMTAETVSDASVHAKEAGAAGFISKLDLTAESLVAGLELVVKRCREGKLSQPQFKQPQFKQAMGERHAIVSISDRLLGGVKRRASIDPVLLNNAAGGCITGSSHDLIEQFTQSPDRSLSEGSYARNVSASDILEPIIIKSIAKVVRSACMKSVRVQTQMPRSGLRVLVQSAVLVKIIAELLDICIDMASSGQSVLISVRTRQRADKVTLKIGEASLLNVPCFRLAISDDSLAAKLREPVRLLEAHCAELQVSGTSMSKLQFSFDIDCSKKLLDVA